MLNRACLISLVLQLSLPRQRVNRRGLSLMSQVFFITKNAALEELPDIVVTLKPQE